MSISSSSAVSRTSSQGDRSEGQVGKVAFVQFLMGRSGRTTAVNMVTFAAANLLFAMAPAHVQAVSTRPDNLTPVDQLRLHADLLIEGATGRISDADLAQALTPVVKGLRDTHASVLSRTKRETLGLAALNFVIAQFGTFEGGSLKIDSSAVVFNGKPVLNPQVYREVINGLKGPAYHRCENGFFSQEEHIVTWAMGFAATIIDLSIKNSNFKPVGLGEFLGKATVLCDRRVNKGKVDSEVYPAPMGELTTTCSRFVMQLPQTVIGSRLPIIKDSLGQISDESEAPVMSDEIADTEIFGCYLTPETLTLLKSAEATGAVPTGRRAKPTTTPAVAQ